MLSTSNTVGRCVLRAVNKIVWVKSTMFFEGKIRGRATEDMKAYFTKWMKAITERGYMDEKATLKKSSTMKPKSGKSSGADSSLLQKRSRTLINMSQSSKSQMMEVERQQDDINSFHWPENKSRRSEPMQMKK